MHASELSIYNEKILVSKAFSGYFSHPNPTISPPSHFCSLDREIYLVKWLFTRKVEVSMVEFLVILSTKNGVFVFGISNIKRKP